MRVPRHFKSTRFDVWHSVDFIMIEEPGRQGSRQKLRFSRLASEEKHLLPRGKNPLPQQLRKNLREPRAACKNKLPGGKCSATSRGDASKPPSSGWRHNLPDAQVHSSLSRIFQRGLYAPPCQQHAAPRFQ